MDTRGSAQRAAQPRDREWSARVLGPMEVRAAGRVPVHLGGPQQRLVLALLVAGAGRPQTTDRLIADVWPDDPPERARKTIQVYVANLRRQLDGPDGPLQPVPNGYHLQTDRITIDAVAFERAVSDLADSRDSDPAEAAERCARALAMWVGAPYADIPRAEPIRAEQVRLSELRLVLLERRIDAELSLGRHRALIGELEALTIEHPYRERFVAQLMLAQYRGGRQADALLTLQRARRTLGEELGIDPGAELRDLEHRILNQDPTLDQTTSAMPSTPVHAPAGTGVIDGRRQPIGSLRGYELRKTLDVDDHATLYRAYQAGVGREVTVKVLSRAVSNSAEFVRRFDEEAQRIAQLEHPHVLPLHDYWRDPDGAYLVMGWVRGGRLVDGLRHDRLTASAALRVIEHVGRALSYAHRLGVTHGAVGPSVVWLDEDRNGYLGDFAVVPAATGGGSGPADVFDAPSVAGDLVGLAALAVELLTGRRPPVGTTVTDERIPPGLQVVLTSALSSDVERRPRRADDLVRAIARSAGVDGVGPTAGTPEPRTDVRNPYKGLRAFGRPDAADFHGREELIAQLVEATAARRLVTVVGPSGSGKSSVVRAGLLPTLTDRPVTASTVGGRSHAVLVTEMFPGAFPFEELETALLRVAVDRPSGMIGDLTSDDRGLLRVVKQIVPDEHHEVLLLVDQFEELFSLVRDAETQQAFLSALVSALTDPRSQLRVVLTLRADFFDRPLEHAAFGELLKQGLTPVTVPSRDELARAVSLPAAAVGLQLEPGLTAEIVADVEGQPGGLPLLQYALTELFRTRTSNRLTRHDYRRIGGVTGALGTRAEELYADLGSTAQEAARQVFLRLVTVGEGADDVRRRVRTSELTTLAVDRRELDAVLERYGSHRLLSFDRDPVSRGPTVEVAHEALLREWARLRGWIESRRTDLILHRRFADAVDEWEQADRDASYLARGGRLAQFEDGVADSDLTLTGPERDFLGASRARRTAEQRAVEERARRQARTNRRLRRLLAGVGVLSVVAAIAGLIAFAESRRAGAAAVAADARRVGALALAAGDVDRALLLAVEGVHLDNSVDTRANLLTTLGRSPELAGVLRGDPDRRFGAVSVSADGRTGAVHDDGSRIHFFDTGTLAISATFEAEHPEGVLVLNTGRAVFHPDGGPVAASVSTLEARPVRLLDPDTFAVLPDTLGGFPGPHLLPWGMAYSPDGTRLAVAFDRIPSRRRLLIDDSVIAVWDLAEPDEPVTVLTDVAPYTHDVAFGPEGRLLYSATHAAPPLFETEAAVTVHDLETGAVVRTLQVPSHPFALSPDGAHIAAASAAPERADADSGTDVLIMDAETGEPLQRLRGHTGPVTDVTFARDGALLASAASDRTVAVWDVTTGQRTELLEGHAADVTGVALGPDGTSAVSAGLDGAVLVWDRAGDRRFVSVREAQGELLARAGIELEDYSVVSPDGDAVLSVVPASDDEGFARSFVQVVDASSGRAGPVVATGHGVAEAAWHPDGLHFATTGDDSYVRIWDAETMELLAERIAPAGGWTGLAYIDGGGQLVVSGLYGTVQRLDAVTLAPRSEPVEYYTGWLTSAYAGADGDVFAIVTSAQGTDVTGNEDQAEDRLLLIDAASGDTKQDLELSFDAEHADLSPDGTLVAVTGDGGQIGLIDVAGGALVRAPVVAHEGAVRSVDYAPDGSLIASGGRDGRVALWDGRTGDLLGVVRVTAGGTSVYVGFASDGHTLTIAAGDGRIRALDVRPERWIDHACAVAGRNLTQREWREAFADRPYRETCTGD